MRKKIAGILFGAIVSAALVYVGVRWVINSGNDPNAPVSAYNLVNHTHAHLEDLKRIPSQWITQAKTNLKVAYGHTSHASQLTDGMLNLDAFMGGNGIYTYGAPGSGRLEFYDYYGSFGSGYVTTFANDLGDLGNTAWAQATAEYLDNADSPDVNVIIWSWCDIRPHDITTYLNHMEYLIGNYSAGGLKGRTVASAVQFVFMTGHVNGDGEEGITQTMNQQIRDHCIAHNQILFDFADIESYDPDDNYFLDKNVLDSCDYEIPGGGKGNWVTEWVEDKTEMTDPSDTPHNEPNDGDWYQCGAAHSLPLNTNLKAYGAWYLFAILAGWDGQ